MKSTQFIVILQIQELLAKKNKTQIKAGKLGISKKRCKKNF